MGATHIEDWDDGGVIPSDYIRNILCLGTLEDISCDRKGMDTSANLLSGSTIAWSYRCMKYSYSASPYSLILSRAVSP